MAVKLACAMRRLRRTSSGGVSCTSRVRLEDRSLEEDETRRRGCAARPGLLYKCTVPWLGTKAEGSRKDDSRRSPASLTTQEVSIEATNENPKKLTTYHRTALPTAQLNLLVASPVSLANKLPASATREALPSRSFAASARCSNNPPLRFNPPSPHARCRTISRPNPPCTSGRSPTPSRWT